MELLSTSPLYRCFEMYTHCLPAAHQGYRRPIVRKGQIRVESLKKKFQVEILNEIYECTCKYT